MYSILIDPIFWFFVFSMLAVANFRYFKSLILTKIIVIIFLSFFILSLPIFANFLVYLQEINFTKSKKELCFTNQQSVNLIILGGGLNVVGSEPALSHLQVKSYHRLFSAYDIYRNHKYAINKILLSGGAGYINKEADIMAEILILLGVNGTQIVVDNNSLNTYQNAVNISQLMPAGTQERNILITSALHMKRASYAFKSAGIEYCQYPVDSIYIDSSVFIPRLSALNKSALTLREMLAYGLYLSAY